MLEYLTGRACRTARELDIKPRTVAVRLRYFDGEGDERARSLRLPSDADPIVLELALELLRGLFTRRVALHHVGVTLSNFASRLGEQGSLFDETEAGRRAALFRAFDGVRSFTELREVAPREDERWDPVEPTRFGQYALRLWAGLLSREAVTEQ